MLSPGYLVSDDRVESSRLHAVEVGGAPLRIEYEPGEGLPGVVFADSDTAVPVWSRQKPASSALFLRVDNRVSRITSTRPSEVTETEGSIEIIWHSDRIVTTLRADAVDDTNHRNQMSTVRLRLALENEGRRSRTVGVRYLLDTWLGEATDAHFRVAPADGSAAEPVDAEREVPARGAILESSGEAGTLRLLTGEGSAPEHIVVANQRRLANAAWSYNPSRRRGFDLPPYSRNDSAVHITFAEAEIEPGERRVIDLYFEVASAGQAAPVVAAEEDDRDALPEVPDVPEDPDVPEVDVPPLPHAAPPAAPSPAPPAAPGTRGTLEEPADEPVDDPDLPQSREEATEELRRELERLREISDGERRAEEGELEEIRGTIERLRRLRDRL